MGAGSAGSDKKEGADTKAAAIADLAANSSLAQGGGAGIGLTDEVTEDFTMPRSETDAAVKNLLNQFGSAEDEENFRGLASDGTQAGIEGENSADLFTRVRGAVGRSMKQGRVINGLNGKI
jgi:hypothetical protein